MARKNNRRLLLKKYTDKEAVISEVLRYTEHAFSSSSSEMEAVEIDTMDEPYIEIWNRYEGVSKTVGVFEMLKSIWVQFQFPIQKGISQTQEYRDATLKGMPTDSMKSAVGLELNNPQSIQLKIHQSIAGKVPVLIVPDTEDFCNVIQALSHKNEPVTIPDAMGAALINGINNWDRIHTLKIQWQVANPFENWGLEFKKNIMPNPALYKDKIIVLSTKPYSNVSANSLSMTHKDWIRYSLQIRLEHECAHLFTLKQYGKMANNMHDELVADYMGIHKTLGRYNSDWFLKFIGLENFPEYRPGARLENYLGNPPLSEEAFAVLRIIIKKAVENVNVFDDRLEKSRCSDDLQYRLKSLCALDLITMASPRGVECLLSNYQKYDHNLLVKDIDQVRYGY